MNYKVLEKYLLSHKEAFKDFPFGEEVAVFKVLGKMFALVFWKGDPLQINLKCDPQEAEKLRAEFEAIKPGYHMNKKHWNTVTLDGSISKDLLTDMIDRSYFLVVNSMRKKDRESLLLGDESQEAPNTMVTAEDLKKILIVYFEEVCQTRDEEEVAKQFGWQYSQASFEEELKRINLCPGLTDIAMGGGFTTQYWNPDRKILIYSSPAEIGVAVWTNKPPERITKFDRQIKKKIEKRWEKMGYKILKCS